MLLEHSADVNSQDKDGLTPLHDTIWGSGSKGDYPHIVRLILERGTDMNARDTYHQTLLHIASIGPADLDTVHIL